MVGIEPSCANGGRTDWMRLPGKTPGGTGLHYEEMPRDGEKKTGANAEAVAPGEEGHKSTPDQGRRRR